MREIYNQYKHQINKAAFLTVFLLIIFMFIKYLFNYVGPFIIGYVLSLMLIPLVNLLSKMHIKVFNKKKYLPRSVASFIVLVVFLFTIGFAGTSIVSKIITQGREYTAFIPEYIDQLRDAIDSISLKYYQYTAFIPVELQVFLDEQILALSSYATSIVGSGVKQGSVNLVTFVPNLIISLFLCIISTFFFMKDNRLIKHRLSEASPDWLSKNLKVVRTGLLDALSGYLKAQFTLAAINACICVVGLTIMKYPYSLFVGLGISILDMLPIFGVGAVLWPWMIFSLLSSNIPRATGLLIIYVTIVVTRQILEPKILGDNIGLHPLATLMSMYIGLKIFGVMGFIIGPLLIIIAKAVWESPIGE